MDHPPYTDPQLAAGKYICRESPQQYWFPKSYMSKSIKTTLCRIVDFERDPPPGVTNFGKIHVELWDSSGDFKYEKCWAPIQKDAHGIIFVYDPQMPNAEETLNQLVTLFPKAMQLQPKFCMVYINHHNVGGAGTQLPKHTIPNCMNGLHRHEGTCEDTQGIFGGFEKYLMKILKLLGEMQEADENMIMGK